MRIVSGMAGGIVLKAPSAGREVRPTSDRVKESLFAALGDLRGWTVVDLFAGTGALGLEALSRGAASVLFVEKDARAVQCIEENLERVRRALTGPEAGVARVWRADVRQVPQALAEWRGRVQLILADPPYRPAPHEYGGAALLADPAVAAWAAAALLVIEHAEGTELPWAPHSTWNLLRQRRFGTRMLSFCRSVGQNAAEP